jgi:hypothetical protein
MSPSSNLPPAPPAPKDNILKHAAIAFVCALVGYIGFYSCDSHLRSRKGPWVVDFASTNGEPLLVINQPALGIQNVRVWLQGEKATNAPGVGSVVRFEHPQRLGTPYGRVRFHDLTYLPGTVTLDLYGHEIELLPRTLFINTKEVPWQNDALFVLTPTNKIPGLKDRDRKGRR